MADDLKRFGTWSPDRLYVAHTPIQNILIPIIERDCEELFLLFRTMPKPRGGIGKDCLFISYDQNMPEHLIDRIEFEFKSSGLDSYFEIAFLNCNLSKEESFYIRDYFSEFDREKFPFGLKSGPNLQFFKSMELLSSHQKTRPGSVLLLETDVVALVENWLDSLEYEISQFDDFLICGSRYKGSGGLPKDIANHINGAAIYHIGHPVFPEYLSMWKEVVRAACRLAPWHAYDVIPEWATFNTERLRPYAVEIDVFLKLYREKCFRIEAIANLSGPAERNKGDIVDYAILEDATLVHLRASPASRAAWVVWKRNSLVIEASSLSFDRDWQFPAVTEQRAYANIRDLHRDSSSVVYFGFPWATFIDRILHTPDKMDELEFQLKSRIGQLREKRAVVTVCQHIHLERAIDLMIDAGVTDIFWSHLDLADSKGISKKNVRLHPFPLYPVQLDHIDLDNISDNERAYLFSFVGAFSPPYYLSQSRNHILERLSQHPRGYIVRRNGWHYDKVVYQHQIKGTAKDTGSLVDENRSDEFRKALLSSIFALCPSGSGPNSIRLWEAIGAGAIPVILADTYAPPGDMRLWNAAAVFCEETSEAIEALPMRLESIARNGEKLAGMRHALRQLWLLYGPQTFVHDVDKLMLALNSENFGVGQASEHSNGLSSTIEGLLQRSSLSELDARTIAAAVSGRLLVDSRIEGRSSLGGEAVQRVARRIADVLAPESTSAQHLNEVIDYVGVKSEEWIGGKRVHQRKNVLPKIKLFGSHSNRTPLSYSPFRAMVKGKVAFSSSVEDADVLMMGFNQDIEESASSIKSALIKNRKLKIVVISEEPLWDTLWSGGYISRDRAIDGSFGSINYKYLNHYNSDIFNFDRIPYFTLTDDRYLSRYRLLIDRNIRFSAGRMVDRWRKAQVPAAFYAEFRDSATHNFVDPVRDTCGLSSYRTAVAKVVSLDGAVRVGQGWNVGLRRQDLPDWHLDKLAALDGRTRIASSYENTHYRTYISEKIFDAFAVGAVPAYYASPSHRVFEMVSEGAMLNGFGKVPEMSARRIDEFEPDLVFADAWLETAASLSKLFKDTDAIVMERRRIVGEVMRELEALL